MKRRFFFSGLLQSVLGTSILSALPSRTNGHVGNLLHDGGKEQKSKALVRIGICTDVHQDTMHDGSRRIKAFIDEMNLLKPDFIIQIGDFCRPYDYNRPFMDIWNSFRGPSYHVLGNHDMDGGFSFEEVVDYWKAKGVYYSFDVNGYHFVVLNGNERRKGDTSKYPRYISEEQREWLKKDLESTSLPVVVFCHQALDVDVMSAIEEATLTRLVFERANEKAGYTKVQMVFSGHHHKDFHNVINNIHYVQINSMSYYWMGEKYKHIRYSEEVDEKHPSIKMTAPYVDPIWAFLTIYPSGEFEIAGKKTQFLKPSPKDLGMAELERIYPVVPQISSRKIKI